MTTSKEVYDVSSDASGMDNLARLLGYKSLSDFLTDNPGACDAICDWVIEYGGNRDGTPIEDED